MKSHHSYHPFSTLIAATLLLPGLSAHAADPDSMADMRKKAAAVEANAAISEPTSPATNAGMPMGDASDASGMKMGDSGSMDASPSSPGMKGMMGGMKGKMGKMKMSMNEMKGMAGDKGMKTKMEGMKSMMSDMEGMMGKMESMMGGMMGDGGMKGMMKDGMGSMMSDGSNGMAGMQMMGSSSPMKSALPGFPGVSHLYHVGSTGFFLDHEEHISLSPEQTKALGEIAEKSRLAQASTDRQIAEANQTLFTLTGADQPDGEKIDAKITEIEKLAAERRSAFIRQVGEAAKVLTDEQRKVLVGQPMAGGSSRPQPTSSGGMSDM